MLSDTWRLLEHCDIYRHAVYDAILMLSVVTSALDRVCLLNIVTTSSVCIYCAKVGVCADIYEGVCSV